jgi:hypothetical protein
MSEVVESTDARCCTIDMRAVSLVSSVQNGDCTCHLSCLSWCGGNAFAGASWCKLYAPKRDLEILS